MRYGPNEAILVGQQSSTYYSSRDKSDQLELRFSRGLTKPKEKEWLFGTLGGQSDVFVFSLAGTTDASKTRTMRSRVCRQQHFGLFITPDLRIHVRYLDMGCTIGRTHTDHKTNNSNVSWHHARKIGETAVVYRGPFEEQLWETVDIRVKDAKMNWTATFEIQFPNHDDDMASDAYLANLQAWAKTPVITRMTAVASMAGTSVLQTNRDSDRVYSRQLDAGAFGQVQLWMDLDTGDIGALKQLKDGLSDSALWDFQQEIQFMSRFDHEHVIKVIDFQQKPVARVLMPYYSLGNIGRYRLRQDQCIKGLEQLLQTLDYLHDVHHIAHRDLKPQNILVASLDPIHIVLSDFGLSKEAHSQKLMHSWAGTDRYMAPEMFSTTDGYDFRADVWSAGVILLEWAHGLPAFDVPFTRGTAKEWTAQWTQMVVDVVVMHRGIMDIGIFKLLSLMLVIEPGTRRTAGQCLDFGVSHGLFSQPSQAAAAAASANTGSVGPGHSGHHGLLAFLASLMTRSILRCLGPQHPYQLVHQSSLLDKVISGGISNKSRSRCMRQSAWNYESEKWSNISLGSKET
ncbi:serine/threonine protein kinase [Sporothrix schenckii ATCC 58251]|uniref:non-specific serine/threonine protein kinase n=1 Tax=Sporothrix schenckii (strain ATCC 58251 / de Perez 2211183) TaxID=1391915 RepID=U7PLS9_SPOS1|nr:serine/threonine protein kinase [Sporothrix schenckii ATCC 58251]